MAVMGHDGPSLPFFLSFRLKNAFKSILIKSNLINEMINQLRQQMKNASKSRNQFGFEYQFEM